MLKYTFIDGDPINGIKGPNIAFISVSTAKKYFGDQNPMGQILSIDKKTSCRIIHGALAACNSDYRINCQRSRH